MNNKRGFTLVELIGVIAILGMVMVIVATNGLGAFNNAKTKLKEEDEKTIVEAAKVLMTDVLYCDEKVNEYLLKNTDEDDFAYVNGFTSGTTVTCDNLISKAKAGDTFTITLDFLIDNKYVTGSEIIKNEGKGISYTGSINGEQNIVINKN